MDKVKSAIKCLDSYAKEHADRSSELMIVSTRSIIAIAEAFRALEQRAEEAEALNKHLELAVIKAEGVSEAMRKSAEEAAEQLAELEKQEPYGYVVVTGTGAKKFSTRHPRLRVTNELPVAVFTRAAPAAMPVDLVPDEMPTSYIYHGGSGAFNAGKESGWNACRAEMLRRIEEMK